MAEYGLGILRYPDADRHEDNDGILHHYITSNVPFMDPPVKTLGIYSNTPIVGVFINGTDAEVDLYIHHLGSIVRTFLQTQCIPYISLYYEDDFGIFIEFKNMRDLIHFYDLSLIHI